MTQAPDTDTDVTQEPRQDGPQAPGGGSPRERPARAPDQTARRWPVALLCALHAPVFAWAASALPWRRFTAFAVVTAALAALHAATAALSVIPHPLAARAFRATSLFSLAYLATMSFALGSSAVYVSSLNRGLGGGLAAALLAVWAVVALLTLPFACYGVASTGGLRRGRRADGALAALLALAALSLAFRHRVAKTDVLPILGGGADRTAAALRGALTPLGAIPRAPGKAPSLFTTAPAACAAPPAPGQLTLVVTFLAREGAADRVAPISRCVQPAPDTDPAAALRAALAPGVRGPIKIDVLSAVQPLGSPGPGLTGLSLRPGLDGICLGGSCLMPWQLIALDAFNANMPIAGIPDFRFGIDLAGLRKALGERQRDAGAPDDPDALRSGLLRVETLSYATDAEGSLHLLSRVALPGVELDASTVEGAAHAAQRYIIAAQRVDGMFRYFVDPFTGRASFDGFSVPRQAGTTLALCELGTPGPEADEDAGDPKAAQARQALVTTVKRSLSMLAQLERRAGEGGSVSALLYPAGNQSPVASLGPTALSLVALLSCRDLAGPEHDALIGRLGRMVLAAQRDDGGFAPELDLARRTPVLGPGNLYEGGQSVLALTLLEALSAREPRPELPLAATLRDAVDRAMDFYATRYWDHFAKDFVYLEENWHCLAARASLGHHRRDAYERFCIDYVTFKSRLVLDEKSGVQADFKGGYGFGNVLPPHNTATAGFGEALAASMALKEARGEDLTRDKALMEAVLGFLVRQQWAGPNCFACARSPIIEGGFSESMASPRIRIDYVQHAWAALGHGGRMLGLVPGRSAPPAAPL